MRSASSFAGIATTMQSRCIALCDWRRALPKRRFRQQDALVMSDRRFDTHDHGNRLSKASHRAPTSRKSSAAT